MAMLRMCLLTRCMALFSIPTSANLCSLTWPGQLGGSAGELIVSSVCSFTTPAAGAEWSSLEKFSKWSPVFLVGCQLCEKAFCREMCVVAVVHYVEVDNVSLGQFYL